MISTSDVEFHTPADADHHWAETNMFNFHLPELGAHCTIYNCFRKGLGVAESEILLYNKPSRNRWDVLYIDTHMHLPAPEKLSHYSLANGMEVQVVDAPRDYRIDYVAEDCELHLDVIGLMDPFDIHDPTMSPNAPPDHAAQVAGSAFGASFGGHFDMTAKVTGTLTLYGETFTVDCADTMDHSWGPRRERHGHEQGGMRPGCWAGGHFSEDYVWHGLWVKNMGAKPEDEFRIAHGYILEDGKVLGLKSGTMVVTRNADTVADTLQITLVDRDDRTHEITGRALAYHDWVCHTCLHVYHTFYEYQARGLTGYGCIQEAFPLDVVARVQGRAEVERLHQTG